MIRRYNGAKAERRAAREALPAGGYVVRILDAKVQHYDFRNGGSVDKLILSFDISEGPLSGFFKRDYNENTNEDRKWRGVYRVSIPKDDGTEQDGWSKNTFNGVIWALEDSNPGFHFDFDETQLKDKLVGVLFRNKEWEWKGNTGWTTECCALTGVEEIRSGKFKMPKDKPLDSGTGSTPPASSQFVEAEDSGDLDLPF
jgi:hypothetical protein